MLTASDWSVSHCEVGTCSELLTQISISEIKLQTLIYLNASIYLIVTREITGGFPILYSGYISILYNWLIWRILKLAFFFKKEFSLYLFWRL